MSLLTPSMIKSDLGSTYTTVLNLGQNYRVDKIEYLSIYNCKRRNNSRIRDSRIVDRGCV